MTYDPKPLDTQHVELSSEIIELCERLAQNAHEQWARKRMDEGWRYGPERDDARQEHPDLLPYEQLPDSEKEYDRLLVTETLKAILALGYRVERSEAL